MRDQADECPEQVIVPEEDFTKDKSIEVEEGDNPEVIITKTEQEWSINFCMAYTGEIL